MMRNSLKEGQRLYIFMIEQTNYLLSSAYLSRWSQKSTMSIWAWALWVVSSVDILFCMLERACSDMCLIDYNNNDTHITDNNDTSITYNYDTCDIKEF